MNRARYWGQVAGTGQADEGPVRGGGQVAPGEGDQGQAQDEAQDRPQPARRRAVGGRGRGCDDQARTPGAALAQAPDHHVGQAENQQHLDEPHRPRVEADQVEEPVREFGALGGGRPGRGGVGVDGQQRAYQQHEQQQGHAQAHQALTDQAPWPPAVGRAGYEVAREQEEHPHEVGLVDDDEQVEQSAGGVLGGLGVEPDRDVAVGDRHVVQDDQHGQHDPQVVDVVEAPSRRWRGDVRVQGRAGSLCHGVLVMRGTVVGVGAGRRGWPARAVLPVRGRAP
ncbi:hypothetical protein HNR06_004821 [Nocardiopsis arvandica]|uniref:Uncharacterized protein n=1 Tax=Nocardiopsis sinuspersici TaxID=501010 RepID=A0A7Z0BN59_9ACTN|nr:hypothetical protein [Nocardiopsis sinuspersici]